MEEHKRKIRSDIMKRVKILYGVFVIVALCVLVRIGYVQFGSRETRINAERLHRRLVFVDSLKAHRGSILARDGRPLATSIFRKSIYFDFGSEGFDKREASPSCSHDTSATRAPGSTTTKWSPSATAASR